MPRNRRLKIEGGVYHVIIRGIERKEIFKDDNDRKEFLFRFKTSLEKTESTCYAWIIMPNHLHLMIRTGIGSLSDIMRSLLTGYAIYFNRRHKRSGYLYQNRYKSILCQDDIYFQELIRYIHLNPIRAKIVPDIVSLDKYQWCGHSAIVGYQNNDFQEIDEVLTWFGKKKREAIHKYREFIKDGMIQGTNIDFMGGGLIRSMGGWKNAMSMKRKKEYWRGDERILGDSEFVSQVLDKTEETIEIKEKLLKAGWDLTKLIKKVCVTL